MNGKIVFILFLKVHNMQWSLKNMLRYEVYFVLFYFKIILGEEGQDAGGLLREWYVIISREIFNPMYALFTVSPGDRVTYMINSSSHCNPNHLCYYKFVGRVIGKFFTLYF